MKPEVGDEVIWTKAPRSEVLLITAEFAATGQCLQGDCARDHRREGPLGGTGVPHVASLNCPTCGEPVVCGIFSADPNWLLLACEHCGHSLAAVPLIRQEAALAFHAMRPLPKGHGSVGRAS